MAVGGSASGEASPGSRIAPAAKAPAAESAAETVAQPSASGFKFYESFATW